MCDWTEYGDEVRRLREARGWSQAELGVYADTSQANIRDVERGNYKGKGPHPDTQAGLQRAFGAQPGQDGYRLTAEYVSPERAVHIAGEDISRLTAFIETVPENRRDAVRNAIRAVLQNEDR